jgi:Domain of unknown function (DUF4292)
MNIIKTKYTSRQIIAAVVIILTTASCSTTRRISVENMKPMSASKLIRKVEREKPVYQNYEAKKISVTFQTDDMSNSVSGQLKIKKDKKIIMSVKKLALPIGKAMVTPDSLYFINYLERSFVSDSANKIQKLIGIELNYNLLQALLTADISSLIEENNFNKNLEATIDSKMYRIDSKIEIKKADNSDKKKSFEKFLEGAYDADSMNYSLWIDPQDYSVKKITLSNSTSKENITILFNQFELVGKSLFPQNIKMEYFSPSQTLKAEMNLSKQTVKTDNEFNFSIPDKYEKINLSKN